VSIGDDIGVALVDGSRHAHRPTEVGWHIDLRAGGAQSSIDLERGRAVPLAPTASTDATIVPSGLSLSPCGVPTTIELAESHYRRSEESWANAGGPTARVTLSYVEAPSRLLRITVDVVKSERTFSRAEAVNPYDNEQADINGDGVQLYFSSDKGLSGWILVPEPGSSHVRSRQLERWPAVVPMSAAWSRTTDGYSIDVEISDCVPKAIDILINEKPSGRERRRGQLVLSGGRGDFVYLRGDRHEPTQLIPIRLADD
jgi:hypothetical protein